MEKRQKEIEDASALVDDSDTMTGKEMLKEISERSKKLFEATRQKQEKKKDELLLEADRLARERHNPATNRDGKSTKFP